MFCSSCGKQLGDSDIFCPACGTRIKKEGSNETPVVKKEQAEMKGEIAGKTEGIANWKQMKLFVYKIVFLILVAITYSLSKEEMFSIFGYYPMTVEELVRYINNLSKLTQTSVTELNVFYWIFKIGMIGYFMAAGIAFLNREGKAIWCTFISFFCHITFSVYIFMKVTSLMEEISFIEVQDVFLNSVWGYLIMNIAVLFFAIHFFYDTEHGRKNTGRAYSLPDANKGAWTCAECGKRNLNYVYVCDCGTVKSESQRRTDRNNADTENVSHH